VLAAGGIENARLLLLGGRKRGRALGNDHDMVGRYFAERMSARSGVIITDRPDQATRTGFYDFHEARGTHAQGALRVTDKLQRERDLLNCVFFPLARPAPIASESVRSIATLVKGLGRRPLLTDVPAHLGNVLKGFGDASAFAVGKLRHQEAARVLVLRVQGEQAPNPDSRVTLGSRTDRLGQPVGRIDWRIPAGTRESIRASQELIDASLRSAGIGHIESMLGDEDPPTLFEGNFHHLGTTRISTDPRSGVVDADCRVHGVGNLWVAGSSTFPTYGASNPTLTIVAMALRLADHLRVRLPELAWETR
jgi:choline dehydrogenase-like flavoprotein